MASGPTTAVFADLDNITDGKQANYDFLSLVKDGKCVECMKGNGAASGASGVYNNENDDLEALPEIHRCTQKRIYVHSDLKCKCCQSCCPICDSCCGLCGKCPDSCCDFCIKCRTCDITCCDTCPCAYLKSCFDFCIKCKSCDMSCCDGCPDCCQQCFKSCEGCCGKCKGSCTDCCGKCKPCFGSCKDCCAKCEGSCESCCKHPCCEKCCAPPDCCGKCRMTCQICASCECCLGLECCNKECNCKPVGCEMCPGPLSGMCGRWHASTDFCPEKCPAILFPCCSGSGAQPIPCCPICPGGKDEWMDATNKFELKKDGKYNITHSMSLLKACCPGFEIPAELSALCVTPSFCADDGEDNNADKKDDNAPKDDQA